MNKSSCDYNYSQTEAEFNATVSDYEGRPRSMALSNQMALTPLKFASRNSPSHQESSQTVPTPRKRIWKMPRKSIGESTKRSMEMAHHQRSPHSSLTPQEFMTPQVKNLKEKRIQMDGMAKPSTIIRLTGVKVTTTPNSSLILKNPLPSLDMVNHQRVLTHLRWEDTSLSVLRDRVIPQSVLKIPMIPHAVIE